MRKSLESLQTPKFNLHVEPSTSSSFRDKKKTLLTTKELEVSHFKCYN